ncbi:hypothetical protein B0H16DRAFT_1519687 [Mycena metata]|uniref:Uncharacterized protein n=1 Tax=Mycena metata TaxID=1033252 RepID=A0AAD7JQN5_9AGAR|nr:hypothetical protein B0H16DRAFT_1519687 [Mycena metata]
MSSRRNGPLINAAEYNNVQGTVHRKRSPSKATYIMPSFAAAFESSPSQPSVPIHQHGWHTSSPGNSDPTILATEYNVVGGDYRRDKSPTEVTFDYSQAKNTQVPANYYATAVHESAGGGVYNDAHSQPSVSFGQPRAQNHNNPPPQGAYGGYTNYNHHPPQPAYGGNNYPAPPQGYGGHNAHPPPQPAYGGSHYSAPPPQSYGNNNSAYPSAYPGHGSRSLLFFQLTLLIWNSLPDFPPQHNQPAYAPPHFPPNGNGGNSFRAIARNSRSYALAVYATPVYSAPANHHVNPTSPAHSPHAGGSRSKSDRPCIIPTPFRKLWTDDLLRRSGPPRHCRQAWIETRASADSDARSED